MKSLKSQNVVHDQNYAKWPQGAILDETDTVIGTPVVRGVYNDMLVNMYALLKDRGITINNIEDSDTTGYQILKALKLVFNEIIDIVKVVQKINSDDLLLSVDLTKVPGSTVFNVKLTDFLDQNKIYKLKDENGLIFNTTAMTPVLGGDDCVLIFEGNASRIYSLNPLSVAKANIDSFQVFGNPISQNRSASKIWYYSNKILSNMNLEFFNIQDVLVQYVNDVNLELRDVTQIDNKFICLVFRPGNNKFEIYSFEEGNFTDPQPVTYQGLQLSSNNPTSDLKINMYPDGINILFTNQGGNSATDHLISKYEYDKITNKLKHLVDFNISATFIKNSNCVNKNDFIFSLASGLLTNFKNNGTTVVKETYGALIGQIFKAGFDYYYTDGHSAKRIQL